MEDFKTYTLEELSIGKGTYGIAASAVPYDSQKPTYLRITDINDDGTINQAGLMSVDAPNASEFLLKANDLVFARTGNSTGRTYFYEGTESPLVYAGFLIKFSIDEKKVNPRILKYYTHSQTYYNWIKSFDTGGTRGNINAKTYGSMPVCLPVSRKTQDKIVELLSSFDRKIELNRRINDNLEQQAQALFKSWFVDFEPFKDGKFVDSELGMIAKGWRVGVLGEVAEFKRGKTITQKDTKVGNIPVIAGGLEPAYYHNIANTTAPVVTISASGANAGFTQILFDDVWASDCSYIDSQCAYLLFAYCFLSVNTRILRHAQVGAAQPHVYAKDVNAFKIALPNDSNVISDFISIIEPIFNHIANNRKNNSTLSIVRDTLLPRLMSGELKINDLNC